MPSDHITVVHGNLTVNVPRSLFKGDDAIPDDIAVGKFRKMLSERYPWLSGNALDVFMRNARNKMLDIIDEETCGRTVAKRYVTEERYDDAVKHLRKHLSADPENVDSWYMLGETLCKAGRSDEGYAAIAKARRLLK